VTVTSPNSDARERLLELIKDLAVIHEPVVLSSGRTADYYVDLRRITLHHEAAPLVGALMLDHLAAKGLVPLTPQPPEPVVDAGPFETALTASSSTASGGSVFQQTTPNVILRAEGSAESRPKHRTRCQAPGPAHFSAVGGLTLGADPIAAAMLHAAAAREQGLDAFVVRKAAKAHGMQRQIEGPDVTGRRVVVVEDTTTTGGSPITAIEAVRAAGGEVVAVATIVDRDTGAREKIEALGVPYYPMYALSDLGL